MKFKPMQLVGLSVLVGIACVGGALVISVINGGPPDALSEGAFAVLSAAIGAIAGYSVQEVKDGSSTTSGGTTAVPAATDWPEEDDTDLFDEFVDESEDASIASGDDADMPDAPTGYEGVDPGYDDVPEPDFGSDDDDWFDEEGSDNGKQA
jgi:hypothetical protein